MIVNNFVNILSKENSILHRAFILCLIIIFIRLSSCRHVWVSILSNFLFSSFSTPCCLNILHTIWHVSYLMPKTFLHCVKFGKEFCFMYQHHIPTTLLGLPHSAIKKSYFADYKNILLTIKNDTLQTLMCLETDQKIIF